MWSQKAKEIFFPATSLRQLNLRRKTGFSTKFMQLENASKSTLVYNRTQNQAPCVEMDPFWGKNSNTKPHIKRFRCQKSHILVTIQLFCEWNSFLEKVFGLTDGMWTNFLSIPTLKRVAGVPMNPFMLKNFHYSDGFVTFKDHKKYFLVVFQPCTRFLRRKSALERVSDRSKRSQRGFYLFVRISNRVELAERWVPYCEGTK